MGRSEEARQQGDAEFTSQRLVKFGSHCCQMAASRPFPCSPGSANSASLREISQSGCQAPSSKLQAYSLSSLQLWLTRKIAFRKLRSMLARENPGIIHVFGRLPFGAWGVLPPERTIFHEMMTGTIDGAWNEAELAEYRAFAAQCARVFAPGSGVAANMRREFGISRPIDVIFTMCPDEAAESYSRRGAEFAEGK